MTEELYIDPESIDWTVIITAIEENEVTLEEVANDAGLDVRALLRLLEDNGWGPPDTSFVFKLSTGEWYVVQDAPYITPESFGLNGHDYRLFKYPGYLELVPNVMGGITAWNDGNTAASPKATDMDGLGADLLDGDTISLATKSLEIDQASAPGASTITAGTLTVDAGITLTLGGDLSSYTVTIAATGVLNTTTTNYAFTTTNACNVSGTLTLNGSTVSCTGTGASIYQFSLQTLNNSTFNGGSGAHTWGSAYFQGTSNVTFSSGTTTVNNINAHGELYSIVMEMATFDDGNGTVAFTYGGDCHIGDSSNRARIFYNFTVNNALCTLHFGSPSSFATTVANNLTITAGSFTTWDGTTSANLTVTNATSITGTLDCKASTVSLGSGLTSAQAVQVNNGGTLTGGSGGHTYGNINVISGGAWSQSTGNTTLNGCTTLGHIFDFPAAGTGVTHNNSTITLSPTADCGMFYATSSATLGVYNLTINTAGAVEIEDYLTANHNIQNNLTLTTTGSKGFCCRSPGTVYTLTIGGNVTVTAGLISNTSQYGGPSGITVTGTSSITGTWTPSTGTCTFNGAVTINNGGTLGGATAWTGDFNSTIESVAGGTFVLPRTFTFSGATMTNGGTTTANSCTMTWDGTVAQSNTAAFTVSFMLVSNASANVTTTSITANGTSGANWNQQQICVSTNAHLQGSSCVWTTAGLQASGATFINLTSGSATVYGILASSETPDSGYRAANVTGSFSLKNADAYSSSFNSSYTLGANMTSVTSLTVAASTTFSTSGTNYGLTTSGALANSGTYLGNASTIGHGNMLMNSGSTTTATTGVTTINSVDGDGVSWRDEGTTWTGGGTLTFTRAGAQTLYQATNTARIFTTIITNNASCALSYYTGKSFGLTCTTLTITSGSFNTWDGTTSASLTTTSACNVSGTLNCRASTTIIGTGVTSAYALTVTGTFTGGSGTHTMGSIFSNAGNVTLSSGTTTLNGNSGANAIGLALSAGTFDDGDGTLQLTYAGAQKFWGTPGTARTLYNLTINNASCAVSYFSGQTFATTVAGALNVTSGTYSTWDGTTSANLTVTGATTVASGGTLNYKASTVTHNGNLTYTPNFVSGGAGCTIAINGTTNSYAGNWTLTAADTCNVGSSATLTFTATKTLSMGGALTNNGTVNCSMDNINAKGTYTGTLGGTGTFKNGNAYFSSLASGASLLGVAFNFDFTTYAGGKLYESSHHGIDSGEVIDSKEVIDSDYIGADWLW